MLIVVALCAAVRGAEPAGRLRAQEPTGLEAAQTMESVLVQAIAKAERSVVAIARVRKSASSRERGMLVGEAGPDPLSPEFVPNEFATGVVIDRQGLILTNYHVLGNPEENDYYVWVNRRPFKAEKPWTLEKVVAGDPWMDLAVLKIAANDLTPVEFGDAGRLKKGMIVIALGNPYAIARDGEVSASWGIVANLNRKAPPRRPAGGTQEAAETLHEYGTLIQTDARLNLGTSGGALVNLRGKMIGLTTSLAALSGYERSAGFAIPVDEAFQRALEQLKAGRKAQYGFLGIAPDNLGLAQRQAGQFGAKILEVIDGTPADRANLEPGDIITQVNDQTVYDRATLFRDLSKLPMDAEVALSIRRGDQQLVKSVKLTKKFVEFAGPALSSQPEPVWRGMQVEFATAMPPGLPRPPRPIDTSKCVGVIAVERDSQAARAGIQPGDYIQQVDNRRVSSPAEFLAAVSDKQGTVRLLLAGVAEPEAVRRVASEQVDQAR